MENSTSYITTVFTKLDVPTSLLEKLAGSHEVAEVSQIVIPNVLETISHSSTETYTTVNVEVIFMSDDLEDFEYIHLPVITPFLFSCVKGSGPGFSLDWATSLS